MVSLHRSANWMFKLGFYRLLLTLAVFKLQEMTYDDTYKQTENVFGSKPEVILEKTIHKIDKTRPVLDIGIGQGRNSFYLAKEGFQVDGIDPSKVAIESVGNISQKEKFNIHAYPVKFQEFTPNNQAYSAILVFGLIQVLDWEAIGTLMNRIDKWTQKGSLVFITAFAKNDASYNKYSKEWEKIGRNSFGDGTGNYRTFLEPNEIIELCKDYSPIYHWEGLGPKHKHGNGQIEQHAMIEFIMEKR